MRCVTFGILYFVGNILIVMLYILFNWDRYFFLVSFFDILCFKLSEDITNSIRLSSMCDANTTLNLRLLKFYCTVGVMHLN